MLKELELLFLRALKLSFSKKKLFFVFLFLLTCGMIVVVCHILSVGINAWVNNSLVFLPIFLCAGIFMAAGIPLIRIYHDEVKGSPFVNYTRTIKESLKLMVGVLSFTIPLVLSYLVLWIILGLFYLLKGIPNIGNTLGVILSFGPFLLIFGSLLLSLTTLFFLFFITPMISLKSVMNWNLLEEFFNRLKREAFCHFLLLFIGIAPILFLICFLVLAATLTGMTYFVTERTWAIGMQWFFIMIPFAAILSPGVAFFFNFSAESFSWIQKRLKTTLNKN